MEENTKEKERLVEGILADARAEAARIQKESETAAEEREKATEVRIQSQAEEMRRRTDEQIARIDANAEALIAATKRRAELRMRESVVQSVLERVAAVIEDLTITAEYEDILLGWLTEAAIGLNAPRATVNASIGERELAERLLARVSDRVRELTGRDVELSMDGDAPVTSQGVVLTAESGRTAFNNQVSTRMLRYRNELRKMIYDTLFKEES